MTEQNPFISIVIPTFNRPVLVRKAIKSVINQTCNDWELIIVDDGGGSSTQNEISEFLNERIQFYKNPLKGRSSARNFGLQKAKGQFISYLDDDDEYKSTFIESTKEFVRNHKISKGIIFHSIEIVKNWNIEVFGFDVDKLPSLVWTHGASPIMYVISKDIAKKESYYENLDYAEDFHLIMRIIANHPFFVNPDINGVYNIQYSSTTNSQKKLTNRKNYEDIIWVINDLCKNHQIRKHITSDEVYTKKYKISKKFLKKGILLFDFVLVTKTIGNLLALLLRKTSSL